MTETTPENNRPHLTRALILLTALLVLFQIVSVIRVLQLPDDLAGQVSLAIPLEGVAGLVWTGVFACASLGLVRKRVHALRYSGWALMGFLLYSVARLLIFSRADYDRERLPFLLVATAAILSVPVISLIRAMWTRRHTMENMNHGSRPQD